MDEELSERLAGAAEELARMEAQERFAKRIEDIAGRDGFWCSSTRDSFHYYAETLMNKGFTEDEAIDFLSGIYQAVGNEYGD